MARKTIHAAQFMYYVPTGETRTYRDGREEEVLSVRHALHGDTVDIPRAEDVAAGEAAGAFVEEEVEQESPVAAPAEPTGPDFSSHDALVAWMEATSPTVQDVVDAAGDDPDKAAMLLDAENTASGGQSRRGVVRALTPIAEGQDGS